MKSEYVMPGDRQRRHRLGDGALLTGGTFDGFPDLSVVGPVIVRR